MSFTFSNKSKGFFRGLFQEALSFLEKEGVPFADSSLRELIRHFLGEERYGLSLLGRTELDVSADMLTALEDGISRLGKGEPPQYITSTAPFFGYDFYVDENVLIPRFDTEILVEKALEYIRPDARVLDLCSGSGCIGIAAALSTDIRLTACDISEGAGRVFEKNCRLLSSPYYEKNPPRFVQGDVFDSDIVNKFPEKFDFILSNPPYIAYGEEMDLTSDVLKEPHIALFGGESGLEFYRRIVPLAKSLLKKGGYLFFECGKGQSSEIMNIMKENGYENPVTVNDYGGIDRVVFASLPI